MPEIGLIQFQTAIVRFGRFVTLGVADLLGLAQHHMFASRMMGRGRRQPGQEQQIRGCGFHVDLFVRGLTGR